MRILIADDQENMRLTLADILTDEGHQVEVVASGEHAVERCTKTQFDVILMDVRMDGIDGVEAMRQLQQRQDGARVILMTAFSTDELKRLALDEGAVAILPKPLDIEHVLKLVGEVKDMTVLIVENDAEAAGAMEKGLKQRGYWVRTVHTPQEALALADQVHFEILFIDVALPTMNGLDLYVALRRATPSSTAIMMCRPRPDDQQLAREAVQRTAYTIVSKPIDVLHVLELLERVTGQRASGSLRKPGPGAS